MCSNTMSPCVHVETNRRNAAEDDDDDENDASSLFSASSNLSDASEQERLREFARNFYRNLDATEKNPSMSKLPVEEQSPSASRKSLFRTSSSSVASNNNEQHGSCSREFSRSKKSARQQSGRLSMRQKLRKSFKAIMGKKCVRFAANKQRLTTLQFIETLEELDVQAIWFSSMELDNFKADAQDMAIALENTPNLEIDHPDWRGLESRSEDGNWNAYKARSDCTNAVLDVQDEEIIGAKQQRRKSATENGVMRIARASREVSAKFVAQAVERAAQDAKIAFDS